jgi:streptogramin lyase
MSRFIVIASAIVVGAALLASLASARTAQPVAQTCAKGSVSARIAGRHTCLKVGQRCRKSLNRQYHRYGFDCRNGRLRRTNPPLPAAGKITATIRFTVGSAPMGAAFASGAVWVGEHHQFVVARIDPATNKIVAQVSTPSGQPGRFAAGPEGLWHLPYSDNTLQQIDPATNRVVTHVDTLGNAYGNCCNPAVGAGSVWVPNADDGVVYRIDASSHQVVTHIPIDDFFGATFGFGSLWGTSASDVFRLDPATNSIATRIPISGLAKFGPSSDACCPAIAAAAGALWVGIGKKVARIDPATNAVAAQIGLPGTAAYVAATDDSVWVVGSSPSYRTMLWRIDPAVNKVVAALYLGTTSEASDLVAGAGSLWIPEFTNDQVVRVKPAG